MKQLKFISFLLCSCASSNIISSSTDGILEEGENDSLEEKEDEDISQEEQTEEDVLVIESGIWDVMNASLLDDPCDWDMQLRQFFGVGSDALLPKNFTVDGMIDSFTIEANSYGARGPIVCTIDQDLQFSCEMQSVVPVDYDLGSMGWTYEIEFSGSVFDEQSLQGTALVRFPTVSEFLVPVFDALAIDISQCTQTYDLTLHWSE